MNITANVAHITFYSMDDAREKKLIRLTKWLPLTVAEAQWINREAERITKDPTRKVLLVAKGWKIALYVNPVASYLGEDNDDDE